MQSYLAISVVILACVLSLAIHKGHKEENKWLSLLLLLYSSVGLLRWGAFTNNHFLLVYFPIISFPSAFLLGSTIFWYTNKILFDENPQTFIRHLIVPGIVCCAHISLLFIIPDKMTVAAIKNQSSIHRVYTISICLSLILYNIILGSFSYSRIIRYKKKFKDSFSNDRIKDTRWLVNFVLANLGLFTLYQAVMIYSFIRRMGLPFTIAEDIVLLVILLLFMYLLVSKPDILPVKNMVTEKPRAKYAKAKLPAKTREKYAKTLEDYMLQKQPFLDENISVGRFSEELNIPQHHLSMTINTEFKKNFYNYVNGHRIRYAENLLKDPKESSESILMIGYQSGFQSKTSFNKAFKTFNNMTPSEYRKTHSPQI